MVSPAEILKRMMKMGLPSSGTSWKSGRLHAGQSRYIAQDAACELDLHIVWFLY